MKIGIIGASGYTGEELVALLLNHPHAALEVVASRSLAGKPLAEALPRFHNHPRARDITCADATDPRHPASTQVDLWFLALPHGVAASFVEALLPTGRTLIDLSADYRLREPATYAEYYGAEHPQPELLASTPYVLPECAESDSWSRARLIACPGCYPTSIQVPLLPLLRRGILAGDGIVVNSASGVTGAGRKLAETYLFGERAESMTPYGLVRHRHLSEIEEQLSAAAGRPVVVQFSPHLLPIRRGILTTITAPAGSGSLAALHDAWTAAYGECPFVDILPEGMLPDTARVAHTNRVEIAAAHDPRTGNFVITSALDNLLKGAAGQAVQIMNRVAGFPETAGLAC